MGFGTNLKGDDSNIVDMKQYIEEHREELEETNQFIKNLEEEVGHIDPNSPVFSENDESGTEELEKVSMSVLVDPTTGEHKIIGRAGEEPNYNFEGVIEQINSGDPDILTTKPFTEQEIIAFLKSADDDTLVNELASDVNISAQALRDLLDIVNRKLNGEKFNIYKTAPDEVKKLVDSYITDSAGKIPVWNSKMLNSARNQIANSLIDEFIHNIKMDRAKTDFAKELENIYSNSAIMASEAGIDHIDERNKAYRDAANAIEDEGKRERLTKILDRIDEARNLTELKEFAKTCKIKRFEAEKPEKRVYPNFLAKYKDSVNNIYDIKLAETVLERCLAPYGVDKLQITMLLIAFCKQCQHYSVDNVLDHAYMYYFLYYCVMLDGDKSDTFKNNLFEVIKNVCERNQ